MRKFIEWFTGVRIFTAIYTVRVRTTYSIGLSYEIVSGFSKAKELCKDAFSHPIVVSATAERMDVYAPGLLVFHSSKEPKYFGLIASPYTKR